MLISKKRLCEIEAKITALNTRVRELESTATTMSFYFGKVDFPKYVCATERLINDLKEKNDRPR